MSLRTYLSKRDFKKTPEPRSGGRSRRGEPAFVVQKHDASHLHYDFRLELGGVLKSWAVPKGPSLDPRDKRLAVEVEDHPVSYGSFEGTIPQGEYGGGSVMVWDTGRWTPLDPDPAAALKKGKLSFTLHGQKLRGGWTLMRMRDPRGSKPQWLLIKRRDEEAREGGAAIIEEEPLSVLSGRTTEQIAGSKGKASRTVARRASSVRSKPCRSSRPASPAAPSASRPAPIPAFFTPQLCTLAEQAPRGEGWLHEIKFDGYRLLARKEGKDVRLITRAGHDWTDRFPPIAGAIAALKAKTAILDGEVVILDERGHASFQRLQQAIKEQKFGTLAFFVFDLPYLDGKDLARVPLLERKERVRRLLLSRPSPFLRYSDHVRGHGESVHADACRAHLEGVVSKQVDAPYVQGRSTSWIKSKCGKRQEFVIVGFTDPGGSRSHLGALVLAAHDDQGRLVYTGRVGTGFDAGTLKDLKDRLAKLAIPASPLDVQPTSGERRGVRWVKPRLVAEVSFAQWTDDNRLRQAAFHGLREDKDARDVKIEHPRLLPGLGAPEQSRPRRGEGTHRTRSAASSGPGGTVAGITITHPARVVYPDVGVTKLEVAMYYERLAERMLPHVRGRPLSVLRCPAGIGECFFQKHAQGAFPEPVRSIAVREKKAEASYIGVDSVEGIVTLVQFGVIEIHPWGARGDDLERPDTMVFDLDPGEGVAFEKIKECARTIRELLRTLGFEPFLKTSGGKGLHVVVPLEPASGWDEVSAFARAIAEFLAAQESASYTASMSKAKRPGRIFIDYLRNTRGATSVAPYSLRARAKAPVSMPIAWEELAGLTGADQFTIASADRPGEDPWREFDHARRPLSDAWKKAIPGPGRRRRS